MYWRAGLQKEVRNSFMPASVTRKMSQLLERKERRVINGGVQTTGWVTLANVFGAFTVHSALCRHKKPKWGALWLPSFDRVNWVSELESLTYLGGHGGARIETQCKGLLSTDSATRGGSFPPYAFHCPLSFGKDTELPWGLHEGLLQWQLPWKAWRQVRIRVHAAPVRSVQCMPFVIKESSRSNDVISQY